MSTIDLKDFTKVTELSPTQREIVYALTIGLAALSILTEGWIKVAMLIAWAPPGAMTAILLLYRLLPLVLSKFSNQEIRWTDELLVKDLAKSQGVKLRERHFFGLCRYVSIAESYPGQGFIIANPTFWISAPQTRRIPLILHELQHFRDARWFGLSVMAAMMVSFWFLAVLNSGGLSFPISTVAACGYAMLMTNHMSRFFETKADKFAARQGHAVALLELFTDIISLKEKEGGSESHWSLRTRYKIIKRFINRSKAA